MRKAVSSLFFSIIFTCLICAPTIVSLLKSDFDVSVFLNVNKEENKEVESFNMFELEFSKSNNESTVSSFREKMGKTAFYLKPYYQFILEKNSPPPEHI